MPRFHLPHSRGNVRGVKKEEEDKVSLFYSEPKFLTEIDNFRDENGSKESNISQSSNFFHFFQISGKGRLGLLTGYCGQHLSRIKSPFRPIPNVWVVLFILFSFSKISKILKFSRHLSCDNCPKM